MGALVGWAGLVVTLIGAVWLAYMAWSNNQPLMALGCFCLAPIFGTIYAVQNFDEAKIPIALVWLGVVIRIVAAFLPQT